MGKILQKNSDLKEENFALAANNCLVQNGIVGDDGGTPYCTVKKELERYKEFTNRIEQGEYCETKDCVGSLRNLAKQTIRNIPLKTLLRRVNQGQPARARAAFAEIERRKQFISNNQLLTIVKRGSPAMARRAFAQIQRRKGTRR